MKNFVLISHDTYFIADRLKEIDPNYFVLYSIKNSRFEVHNLAQKGGTFCFALPYSTLDERALDLSRKTRTENLNKIIEEIEKSNQKLEKDNIKNAKNKLREVLS